MLSAVKELIWKSPCSRFWYRNANGRGAWGSDGKSLTWTQVVEELSRRSSKPPRGQRGRRLRLSRRDALFFFQLSRVCVSPEMWRNCDRRHPSPGLRHRHEEGLHASDVSTNRRKMATCTRGLPTRGAALQKSASWRHSTERTRKLQGLMSLRH